MPVFHIKAGGENSIHDTAASIKIADLTLINAVPLFPSQWFSSDPENERAQGLMDKYLISILEWDR